MKKIYFTILYLFAIIFWLFFWNYLNGYSLMQNDYPLLWLPFLINLVYLIGNLLLNSFHWYVGEVSEEEELFNPINV